MPTEAVPGLAEARRGMPRRGTRLDALAKAQTYLNLRECPPLQTLCDAARCGDGTEGGEEAEQRAGAALNGYYPFCP